MQKIGVSQETDIGEIQFQSGYQMMEKRLFALNQSSNLKNYQVLKASRIFTESLLIKLLFHQSKVKVNLKEFQKFSTAGLNLELCPSRKVIIHTQRPMKNS
jgi:hypothetical protein